MATARPAMPHDVDVDNGLKLVVALVVHAPKLPRVEFTGSVTGSRGQILPNLAYERPLRPISAIVVKLSDCCFHREIHVDR